MGLFFIMQARRILLADSERCSLLFNKLDRLVPVFQRMVDMGVRLHVAFMSRCTETMSVGVEFYGHGKSMEVGAEA